MVGKSAVREALSGKGFGKMVFTLRPECGKEVNKRRSEGRGLPAEDTANVAKGHQ